MLATLFAFGWPLALAVLPFLAYAALSPVLARARIDRLGSRAREASGEMNAHAVDTVQGLVEIVAFQQERARGVAFAARARAYVEARLPFLEDLTRQTVLQEIATGLGGLAVVATGAMLASTGRLDGGDPASPDLAGHVGLRPRVGDRPGRPPARRHAGRHAPGVRGARRARPRHGRPRRGDHGDADTALEMKGVRFTYPGRTRPTLDDVSIAVPAGHTTALVGPSGAGKTTIASLFLRFWDPSSGAVGLDEHDLRDYRLDELRGRIALVAQDTYLFNDTLRNNILIARPSASEAEVAQAVAKASLDDFVRSLPEGLDTLVGERGAQLSGGQRQRVAIARAFLKDAPILILDEATSHLDAVNEQAVRDSLAVLAQEPHHARHRPPPVHRARRRPDHRPRRRARGGDGRSRDARSRGAGSTRASSRASWRARRPRSGPAAEACQLASSTVMTSAAVPGQDRHEGAREKLFADLGRKLGRVVQSKPSTDGGADRAGSLWRVPALDRATGIGSAWPAAHATRRLTRRPRAAGRAR